MKFRFPEFWGLTLPESSNNQNGRESVEQITPTDSPESLSLGNALLVKYHEVLAVTDHNAPEAVKLMLKSGWRVEEISYAVLTTIEAEIQNEPKLVRRLLLRIWYWLSSTTIYNNGQLDKLIEKLLDELADQLEENTKPVSREEMEEAINQQLDELKEQGMDYDVLINIKKMMRPNQSTS